MKICLYSHVFAPSVGGIETSSLSLAGGWAELGHDVLLATSTPAPEGYDKGRPFRVVRTPGPDSWKSLLAGREILVSNGHSLKYFRQWRRSGIPFGWIHAMSLTGGLNPSLRTRIRLRLRGWTTHLGSFNVCVSKAVRRDVPAGGAVVIPNPVSPMFRPLAEIAPGKRYLYFGRMWMPKGLDTLLEAVDICRRRGCRIELDLYGDGEDLPQAKALAQKLGLDEQVSFHPGVSGEELVRVINRAKAVIVPSRCHEAFGLAAAEAMACGKCVIASRDGGLEEMLAGVGSSFTPGRADELAEFIMAAEANPESLQAFAARSLAKARDFELLAVCRRYVEFFQAVAARAG